MENTVLEASRVLYNIQEGSKTILEGYKKSWEVLSGSLNLQSVLKRFRMYNIFLDASRVFSKICSEFVVKNSRKLQKGYKRS